MPSEYQDYSKCFACNLILEYCNTYIDLNKGTYITVENCRYVYKAKTEDRAMHTKGESGRRRTTYLGKKVMAENWNST